MLETMTHAMARLAEAGFTQDLVVDDDGTLRAVDSDARFHPDDLVVAETVRFEGETDPDDEAMLLAVAATDGTPIGTYTIAYGADVSMADADMLRHLTRGA